MSRIRQMHGMAIASVMVLAAWGPVRAEIIGNLDLGNTVPVTNALGQTLRGSWGSPDSACRVEIREMGPAIIPPDPVTGEGNEANNPLIAVSYMGQGVLGTDPGMFSVGISNRLQVGTSYYVRVYSPAGTPPGAIYYANTAPFAGPAGNVPTINVEFQEMRLVSTGLPDVDTDGDGIPDVMELDMGLYPGNSDTDGDGYNDGFEAKYNGYMHVTEPDPPMDIQLNPPLEAGVDPHTVTWWTIPVPGMTYQLEYTDALPFEDEFTEPVGNPIVATDTQLEVEVEDWMPAEGPKGFFRVTVPY